MMRNAVTALNHRTELRERLRRFNERRSVPFLSDRHADDADPLFDP